MDSISIQVNSPTEIQTYSRESSVSKYETLVSLSLSVCEGEGNQVSKISKTVSLTPLLAEFPSIDKLRFNLNESEYLKLDPLSSTEVTIEDPPNSLHNLDVESLFLTDSHKIIYDTSNTGPSLPFIGKTPGFVTTITLDEKEKFDRKFVKNVTEVEEICDTTHKKFTGGRPRTRIFSYKGTYTYDCMAPFHIKSNKTKKKPKSSSVSRANTIVAPQRAMNITPATVTPIIENDESVSSELPAESNFDAIDDSATDILKKLRIKNVNRLMIATLNINSIASKLDQLKEVIGNYIDVLTI